jgi:hypothetical protein
MDDVAKFFQPHQMIHFDRLGLADTVDVVAGKVNQHDMLCSIFFGA